MEIRVKCSCGADKYPEWAIVELHGVVEIQPSFHGKLQSLESCTFTVGYHELTGSKVTLKKPLLVLKKVKCMHVDQLEVVGIIRHKILFKTRPKALIPKPPPAAKKTTDAAGPAVTD